MNTHARPDLAPPAEAGSRRAMVLSLLAHLLLAAALAWGVNWNHTDPQVGFNAELWSPTAQEAAPAAVQPPPPPPTPEVKSAPPPPPAAEASRPEPQPQADIALEREKKRKLEEERKKAEALKDKAEKEKAEKAKLAKEKAEKARKEEEARKLKDKEKERELAKAKEEARKEQVRKEAAAQAAQEKIRQEQLQRIQGLAGATGGADAKGAALRSAAPSSSYAGKIIEQIKNNTTFTDASAGRPSVVVLVKTAPNGQILSRKVVTSSGNKAWDEAVLRAVDKMGSVPRDVDGRIPEVLLQDGLEIKVTL